MKIKKVKIKGYKSIGFDKWCEVNFQDYNYVFGENNSGKSNLLKFLELVFRRKKTHLGSVKVEGEKDSKSLYELGNFFDGIIENERYIFHKNISNKNIQFEILIDVLNEEIEKIGIDQISELKTSFLQKDDKKANHFNIVGEIKYLDSDASELSLVEVKLNSQKIFNSNTGIKEYFGALPGAGALKGNRNAFFALMGHFNEAVMYIENNRFFQQEKIELGSDNNFGSNNVKNYLFYLSTNEEQFDKFKKLIEFVRHKNINDLQVLKDFDISFAINKGMELELFLFNGSERLPISSFGTGINQIMYLLIRLFVSNSPIIMIEELELNLSHRSQGSLLGLIKSLISTNQKEQLIFTSHSDYFDFQNDMNLIFTELSPNRSSVFKSVRAKNKYMYERN